MMKGKVIIMAKEKEINAILIMPKHLPEKITIENKLSKYQQLVNGHIECFDLPNGVTIICNEEGKINGLDLNHSIKDEEGKTIDIIAGNMVIVGIDYEEGEFISLTEKQIENITEQFFHPEIFFKFNDELHIINTDWKMKLTSLNEISFFDKNNEIKDKLICNDEVELIRTSFSISQMYMEIAAELEKDLIVNSELNFESNAFSFEDR